MSNRIPRLMDKKEQFVNPKKSKLPSLIAVAVVVVAGASALILQLTQGTEDAIYFGDPVAASRSYIGEVISMTPIEPEVEDGRITLSFDEVDQNGIVNFETLNSENETVPMMAYITPTGRLFVGSSMCEPCRGKTFSLAGETLVCDTCRTTYDIENHEFLAGAEVCGQYPPVNMNPRVENGSIIIDQEQVLQWRIRT